MMMRKRKMAKEMRRAKIGKEERVVELWNQKMAKRKEVEQKKIPTMMPMKRRTTKMIMTRSPSGELVSLL